MRWPDVLRHTGALTMALMIGGCSGAAAPIVSAASPRGATASRYIGTFPITYSGTGGTCTASVLPTQLQITAVASGQDDTGEAITLLSGLIIGGTFSGTPLSNVGGFDNAATNLPSAYVVNSSGLLVINAFFGLAQLAGSVNALTAQWGNWRPPASPNGFVDVQTPTCNEGEDFATIGPPQ